MNQNIDQNSQVGSDTNRKRLANHRTYGGGWAAGPWVTLIFGFIFIGVGTAVILLAMGIIPSSEENFNAPKGLVGIIGGIFAVAGVSIVLGGVNGVSKKAKLRNKALQHPDQPWLADYNWSEAGSRDDTLRQVTKMFMGAIFISVFMVPFNWLIFFSDESVPFFVHIIISIFDLAALAAWGYAVYLLGRWLKYRDSRIIFDTFPFFLGQMLSVRWSPSRALGNYNKITFILRCVEEVKETTGTGKNRQTQIVSYQIWADQFVVDEPGRHEGLYDVPVTFLLPADGRPTKINAPLAQYWEIEIHADTPGIDFKADYMVPVYAPVR